MYCYDFVCALNPVSQRQPGRIWANIELHSGSLVQTASDLRVSFVSTEV